jgi:hypothetical protein
MKSTITAALVLALTLAACGKRGEPHPPVPVVPQATTDLVVTQRGEDVVLTWTYPSLTTAGRSLGRFDRLIVYRYDESLPPAIAGQAPANLEPGTGADDIAPQILLFDKVPPLSPRQFTQLRQGIATLRSGDLPSRTAGATLIFVDTPPRRSDGGAPLRLSYAVVTELADAESDLSNIATIVPLDPPGVPRDLRATAEPEGVVVSWERPAEEAQLVGYNVYRISGDLPPQPLDRPVSPSPVRETTFRDVPPYGSYRYAVAAVASAGPPLVQGAAAVTGPVEFRDVVAPPAPTAVNALAEEDAIQVVWDGPEAADLAGYHVYRESGGRRERLTAEPVTVTFYRDEAVARGARYLYLVSSVDALGNESAPVAAPEVLLPR